MRWRAYPQWYGEVPEREPSLLPGTRALGDSSVFPHGSGTRKAPRTGALCRLRSCLVFVGLDGEPANLTWVLALSIFILGPCEVDPLWQH